MAAVTGRELHELAKTIAEEVRRAASGYTGPKWETVEDKERAVSFTVTAASLEGKKLSDLRPAGKDFQTAVQLAEVYPYRDSAGYTRSAHILNSYHFNLEIKDGIYTGQVTVYEKSFDFDS